MNNTFTRFEAHPAGGLQPSADVSNDAFTTGDTTELDYPYVAADDGSVLVGVWECAPSRMVFDPHPVNEMMTILSGSVTLTSLDDDRVETFTAGDTFFVAKGARFVWEITETLRKYYFISA